MKRTFSYSALALALGAALLLSACNKNKEESPPIQSSPPVVETAPPPIQTPPPATAPVAVTSITLGNQVDSSQNVTMPSDTFAPTDTIYASVATSGMSQSATLRANWTYQDGQTVNESSQTIAPNGDAVTTFHIAKPDGWPTGDYKVEISLNGNVAQSKGFTIK